MGIIVWIIFGALVGWIASIIMKTNQDQGAILNIVVGIVGALLGGLVANMLGMEGITGFNLSSFLIALGGAIILLGIVQFFFRTGNTR